jgi:hypothetical protein
VSCIFREWLFLLSWCGVPCCLLDRVG